VYPIVQRVTLDIHNYPRMFAHAETQVQQSTISQRNKDLIFSYRDACLLRQTCGKVRLIRVMGVLLLFARSLGKDFDQASREDVQQLVARLLSHQPAYSAQTIGTYKAILKRFYTWLGNPAEFSTRAPAPAIVSWITTHVRSKDKKKLQRGDLLVPGDIERVVDVSQNARDQALVSVLWETGGRIGEIGNLQLKHVTKEEYGYTLDLTGKTGQRTPLIVSSAPALTRWLNNHPFRNDLEAPLWVHYQYATTPHPMMYSTIRGMLVGYFRRIGITKRVYPHLFRHSRATYCLASGLMTEAQAKAYFGWTPSSDQLATYAHLLASDANASILRENNLAPTKEVREELRASKCYRCGELNASNAEYCTKCNAILDLKRAYEHQQVHDMKEELFFRMFKVMVERGLVDDAAREIHDAGLGALLKTLAQHVRETEQLQVVKQNITDVKQKEVTPPQQLTYNGAHNG
jgi:integrase/recombinase XerD